MQCAVRDAPIAFMAATAQSRAEATKSSQRAGIDHKRRVERTAYLGRKPSGGNSIAFCLPCGVPKPLGHRPSGGPDETDRLSH
jgi:hypothetical protein